MNRDNRLAMQVTGGWQRWPALSALCLLALFAGLLRMDAARAGDCYGEGSECSSRCPDYDPNACDYDDSDDDEDDPDGNTCPTGDPCAPSDACGPADAGEGLHMRLTTGNVWTRVPVFSTFANGEVELDLELRYDSQRAGYGGPVGYGWTHSYNAYLTMIGDPGCPPSKIIYWEGNGRRNAFKVGGPPCDWPPPKPDPPIGRSWDLVPPLYLPPGQGGSPEADHYVLTKPDGSVHTFDRENRISAIADRRGRLTLFDYGSHGRLSRVISPHGRIATFEYNAQNRL
ncbi:MAG: DUF6531 domain-containing protein [Phycisphaerae bacterium]